MAQHKYTNERNLLIILALLKEHGIKRVVASPGSCNHTLVKSMQDDEWFEMYSSIDERSAAYMACGLASESGSPVVVTCTEATASRNFMPGLTEAYYRKLPVLAIATTHGTEQVGQLVAQTIDQSVLPKDVCVYQTFVPSINTEAQEHKAVRDVNEAILALWHHGGGPVYLCAQSLASRVYVGSLPKVRVIKRYTYEDLMSSDAHVELPKGRIGIFVGSHKIWTDGETKAVERFCEQHNAVVFCDHTSNYIGKYKVLFSLVGGTDDVCIKLDEVAFVDTYRRGEWGLFFIRRWEQ